MKPFSLHCAYPADLFDEAQDRQTLVRMRAEHTLVLA